MAQLDEAKGGNKRTAVGTAEQGEAPSEEEKHATLQYVMYTLAPHLFTELLTGFPFSAALFEESNMHTER